jgi:CheY-like chemotaxis protein
MMTDTTYRILLVEDDHAIAQVLAIGMRQLGLPHTIDEALSAEEGFDLWSQQPYDLLVTDYNLRGTNGLALISQVRKTSGDVPTMLFTAYDTPQLRNEARAAGVSVFISKPFLIDEFVAQARSLLPAQMRVIGA